MKSRMAVLQTILALTVLLSACGQYHASTTQDVLGAFAAAGLHPTQSTPLSSALLGELPYREGILFALPETGNRGGLLVMCNTSQECDRIFLALYRGVREAEVKPYFMQSRDGTILLQLSRSLDPALVARYETVIKSLE